MATRSRRSAAGSDSLNPAMIQLYDTGRLRRELKQRGLDTTGTRNVLADRLQEAVLSERNSRQAYSPPPQPEKLAKRGTKRSLKGDEENESELQTESIISPNAKRSQHSEEFDEINLIEESFSIELSRFVFNTALKIKCFRKNNNLKMNNLLSNSEFFLFSNLCN
ncbi:unnamed protein product [Onchocerca flexuosa]|uniref:SAP domain-containing protein n=1 Tax=Onchocerca flexuosa TaxID=387005 RepID=A0A183HLC8_9BILA|nr:unnamed protein product [Onchocerca flexuosa]